MHLISLPTCLMCRLMSGNRVLMTLELIQPSRWSKAQGEQRFLALRSSEIAKAEIERVITVADAILCPLIPDQMIPLL